MRRQHQMISTALVALLGLLFAIPGAQAQLLVSSSTKLLAYDPGTGAALTSPTFTGLTSATKVAFGPDGYVYAVGMTTGTTPVSTIVRYTAAGVVDTTFTSPAALPTKVGSIAFGSDGKLYVTDYANGKVLRFLATGALDTTLISGLGSAGDLVIDGSGNVWFADPKDSFIYELSATGSVIFSLRLATTPLGPAGIAIDSSQRLLVALPSRNEILRYSSTGVLDSSFIIKSLGTPAGISLDLAGNAYVVDTAGARVVKVTQAAVASTFINAGLNAPISATWSTTIASVSAAPGTVTNSVGSTGTITLAYNAPANLVVTLKSSNPAVTVPATATVLAGTNSITFPISTNPVTTTTPATITASVGGVSQKTTVSVTPTYVQSVAFDKTTIASGGIATGTVTLDEPAGTNGTIVTLTNSSRASATLSATTVTVPANTTTATFTLTGKALAKTATAIIGATAYDQPTAITAPVTVSAVTAAGVSFNATKVIGGATATGTVTLSAAPTDGPAKVTLTSSNTAVATVPAIVTVSKGATTATFTVTTLPVSTTVTPSIAATFGGASANATLIVRPIYVSSVSVAPSAIASGKNAIGTVTLEQAPTQAVTISLSTGTATALKTPSTVTVSAKATSATFIVNSSSVLASTPVTIGTTSYDQATPATTTVTVNAITLTSGLPGNACGPVTNANTIALSALTPSAVQVTVTTANPHVTFATVAAGPFSNSISVTVPAGQATAAYYAKFDAVTTQAVGKTTVTYNGASLSGTTTDLVNGLSGIRLSQVTFTSAGTATGTVTTYQPVSVDTTVNLTASAVLTLSTTTVTIPAGKAVSNAFTVTVPAVTTLTNASITAKSGTSTVGAGVVLTTPTPPGTLVSITLSNSTVHGSTSTQATIKLNSAATAAVVVALTSSDPSASFVDNKNNPISSVTIPAGQTSITVNVNTTTVIQTIVDSLTATQGAVSVGAGLTVTP